MEEEREKLHDSSLGEKGGMGERTLLHLVLKSPLSPLAKLERKTEKGGGLGRGLLKTNSPPPFFRGR